MDLRINHARGNPPNPSRTEQEGMQLSVANHVCHRSTNWDNSICQSKFRWKMWFVENMVCVSQFISACLSLQFDTVF